MNYTSQKITFQTYSNGVAPHIGVAPNEESGYWYIGTENTGIKAEGTDARTMLLSNDSDIIVRNNLGQIVGSSPNSPFTSTQVFVMDGANKAENPDIQICEPSGFDKGDENGDKKHFTFSNGLLNIYSLPTGFTSGAFTFKCGVISKTFSLKVVSSEVDYDLIIDKTLINTTNVPETGGSVTITVKKTDSNDTSILTANSNEAQLKIGGSTNPASSWIIPYEQGDTTAIPVMLEVKVGDAWIEWDKETIEFVANGEDSVAYWLAASSPIIAKTANGEYSTTSITFTPMIQIGNGTPKVANYDDDKVKLAIWRDDQSAPDQGTLSEAQTVTLVKPEEENSSQNKLAVSNALYCRMFLYSNNYIKVDEQTVEVLADGVTISDVKYSIDKQGATPPTSGWETGYPSDDIAQGKYLWTKTIYSNNQEATSVSYLGVDATPVYAIEMSNDGATIGTDVNGNRTDWTLLETVTKNKVTVHSGADDITDSCNFSWAVSAGTLSNTNTNEVYFKKQTNVATDPLGADSATAIVTVTKKNGGAPIGSKSYTITKLKQGEPGNDAITYMLAVSPNSWNKSEKSTEYPTFTVTKYEGSKVSTIKSDYTIKVGSNIYNSSTGITETTTFDLWIGENKVDSETVTAVANGADSDVPGPPGGKGSDGKTRGTITLYSTTTTMDSIPGKPTSSTIGNGKTWQTNILSPDSTNKFVWETKGAYTENLDGSNRTYDSNWTTPELHSAFYADNVSVSTAAEYYKLFGTDIDNNGMKYNDDGKLFINATMINTGTLTITKDGSEKGEPLFSAGWIEDKDDSGNVIKKTGTVKIGALEVGEIAGKGDIPNVNLAIQKHILPFSHTGFSEDNYCYTISGNNPGSSATGLKISEAAFEQNKSYVVSFYISFSKNSADEYEVAGHCTGVTFTKIKVDDKEQEIGEKTPGQGQSPYNGGIVLSKELNKEQLIELYFVANKGTSDNNLYIQPNRSPSASGKELVFKIRELKIEEGTRRTPWTPPSDVVRTSQNGNFSWKFSPTEGMFMWDGPQQTPTEANPTGGAVLAIYKKDNNYTLNMKGEGEFTGKVTAREGRIGNWQITATGINNGNGPNDRGSVGINQDESWTYRSLITSGDSPVAFYAGYKAASNTYNFLALNDGSVYMNAASIGGETTLGGETINTILGGFSESQNALNDSINTLNSLVRDTDAAIASFNEGSEVEEDIWEHGFEGPEV